MTSYRVTVSARTNGGRWLSARSLDVLDADDADDAFAQARREFFSRTALVSGVKVEQGPVVPVVMAYQAVPGTWVRLHGQWQRVAHWERVSQGLCRLFTGEPGTLYPRDEGVYARHDTFETR